VRFSGFSRCVAFSARRRFLCARENENVAPSPRHREQHACEDDACASALARAVSGRDVRIANDGRDARRASAATAARMRDSL
jgi:hypothetical protein